MNNIHSSFRQLLSIAGLLALTGIAAAPATAAPVIFNFTGDVDRVAPRLAAQFNTGQTMSGTMTVNPSGPISHPGTGIYTIETFSLNIGGYTATMGPSGQVEIRDRLNGLDRLNVTVNAPIGSTVNQLAPSIFEIQLRGPASVFGSNALPTPTTSPSISAFSNFNQWRLVFGPGGRVVAGTVLAMTAVPLPAAVVLFGAGLVALAGLGAGSWRQRKNSIA
ncbi:MAG: hypothetical protein Q8N04_09945 [Nitrospira sp.]|nr:hypothetical protein [Nitrospira sp.]